MLLRAIALLSSLFLHALILDGMWSRLKEAKLDVLELGVGQDIVLEPQGMVLSEVTNVGDAVQTIETQQVVPHGVRPPPPAPAAVPPEQIEGVLGAVETNTSDEVAALEEQKPSPSQPATPPEQLRDVISSEQSKVEQKLVELDQPPPPNAALQRSVTAADEVAPPAEIGQQIRPLVTAGKPRAPDPLSEQTPVEVDQPLPPETLEKPVTAAKQATVPRPDRVKEASIFAAKKSIAPDTFKEPTPVEADRVPPPDEIEEPAVATAKQTSPIRPIKEQEPELLQLLAQPEQVAIVTEQSSGEESTGGEASIVGLYLGRINERVQQSKVNPRSPKTGMVTLMFTVGRDGSLVSKHVATPSGIRLLDEAALAAIDRAAPFPPIPDEVSKKPMTFRQTFKFVIR